MALMASTETSRLNVRMDADLRAAGDAVLKRMGVTPAEVVRAPWAKIARGTQDCEQALSMEQGTWNRGRVSVPNSANSSRCHCQLE